ncbi:uncharacterized protein LOC134069253 [Sardina pilchardus]|uniref:uncharacterized protein LOC134069253 n=1 Tax=Sardina pilchardus TaxID=27697 RepID=UPI002E12C0E3
MANAKCQVQVDLTDKPVASSLKETVAADDSAGTKDNRRSQGSFKGEKSPPGPLGSSSPDVFRTPKRKALSRQHMKYVPKRNLMEEKEMDRKEERKRKSRQEVEHEKPNKKRKTEQKQLMQAEARQKEVQRIQDMTLQNIRRIIPHFQFKEPLVDDGKRSSKGEHVINKDVITFYHMVDDFRKNNECPTKPITLGCPLEAAIDELVVHFDKDELYINANAVLYGEYSRALKKALTACMQGGRRIKDNAHNDNEPGVSSIVQHMNKVEAYVDEFAKNKFIGDDKAKKSKFETIRNETKTMFSDLAEYFDPEHVAEGSSKEEEDVQRERKRSRQGVDHEHTNKRRKTGQDN